MSRQRILTVVTAAVFLVAAFGTINMGGESSVSMGCGATEHATVQAVPKWCSMNVADHLAWWGNTFRGILSGDSVLAALVLFAAVLVATKIYVVYNSVIHQWRFTSRGQDPPNLYNFYALFLAAGKAQPRL